MSRSLDPDTKASISISSPSSGASAQTIYNDLVHALNPPDTTSLLEIEILGKSHAQALPSDTNVLVDGPSIAVPKSTLVKAFIVARKRLFASLAAHIEITSSTKEIRDAAAVMLLMDPEHVTAANARKRVVQGYAAAGRETELREKLWEERRWLDGMLTSRLHRHTKSPTLWGHRRWLLELWMGLGMPYDIHEDLRDVVLVAAERHFCNYYAWMHLRWLVHRDVKQCGIGEGTGRDEVSKMLKTIKSWCLRHPTDTAGFSFMLFCLYEPRDEKSNNGRASLLDTRSSVSQEVLDRAVSFKWTNEAVWVFLRTLIAYGVAEEQRTAFFESIKVLREARGENPKSLATLQAAHDWVLTYERVTRG